MDPGHADVAPPGVLSILVAPHPQLKARARPVSPADATLVAGLVPRMLETMYAAPGIGLAAPQVGVPLRLVVLDLQPEGQRDPMVLINPEITAATRESEPREEGCLSLPNQFADVVRPVGVTVRYQDAPGARRELHADGLLARCLQHEIDHLDGVLFIDHLSVLRRNMIMRKLAKELAAKERR
jgi:peptide deformylase